MSERREPGEIVRCTRTGAILRLSSEQDGELHYIGDCSHCDDPECREWSCEVLRVLGVSFGVWSVSPVGECQMETPKEFKRTMSEAMKQLRQAVRDLFVRFKAVQAPATQPNERRIA